MGVEIPSDFWEYLLPSAFKQKETPTVHTRPIVFDWKEALKPFMPAKMNNISKIVSAPCGLGRVVLLMRVYIYIYLNYFKSKRY